MNKLAILSLAFGSVALIGTACAATPQGGEEQHTNMSSPSSYKPGLGDFMTAYVQPHHIKLWAASKKHNWKLAAYEAKELKETFEDIATYQGDWHKVDVGSLVKSMIYPPLSKVDQAIAHHNAREFRKAYASLTNSCTACHAATGHKFVVIKPPKMEPFADQQF